MKKQSSSKSKSSHQKKNGSGHSKGHSSSAIALLSSEFPEKFNTVKKFKDQGSKIWQEAKDMVADAAESIPESTKKTIATTQKKVLTKMRERPVLTTAAAATVAAVGAGLLANKLCSAKSLKNRPT